jgi:epoxyqueuosine reductase QueG
MFDIKEFKEYLISLGASDIGFAKLNGAVPEDLGFLSYSITIVINLLNPIINQISDKPTKTYFHHYRTVNSTLDYISLMAASYLQKKGYSALTVAASQTVDRDGYKALFPHKTGAVLSGLGWIGKSDLFLHNEWGPRVRLATVLTDAPISDGSNINMENDKCGDCNLCKEVCPAMAIVGTNWKLGMERGDLYDAFACSNYMKDHFKDIGRGSVCGICIKVCPYGKLKVRDQR